MPAIYDAIVIGAGPSGLGASLSLSGYSPYYAANCALASSALKDRLAPHKHDAARTPLTNDLVRSIAPQQLQGRSHNPLALFFDGLQHPGVDSGWRGAPSCLELRRDGANEPLSHLVLDANPAGGAWHTMHESTLTLSPGPWMELPNYPLSTFLMERSAEDGTRMDANAARAAAAMRQPRRLVAEYLKRAAEALDIASHHRPWRVTRVEWSPTTSNNLSADGSAGGAGAAATATPTTGGLWTVVTDGAPPEATPLLARNLVLATGTYGIPTRLNIEGEDLPIVAHRCAQLPSTAQTVLVVGAGLSAADCIVHSLRQGRTVLHVHRGACDACKLNKFAAPQSAGMYPEYHALFTAMKAGQDEKKDGVRGTATPLLGGTYSVFGRSVLTGISPDGQCQVDKEEEVLCRQSHDSGSIKTLCDEVSRKRGSDSSASATPRLLTADAVAILIGSSPDLSFLPPSVHEALAAAGEPSQHSTSGVKATHKVFIDVEPYTMETTAVPSLFALGPLRGDNFARFAIHDGHGVAEAIRARKTEVGLELEQEACDVGDL